MKDLKRSAIAKSLKVSTLFVAFVLSSVFSFASDSGKGEKEKKFSVKETALHHIMDSHEFHLWGEGHSSVSIPLPIILITDNGLDVFLSSKFDHETGVAETSKGKYYLDHHMGNIYYLEGSAHSMHHKINEGEAKAPLDFSITKNVFSMFLSVIVLLLVFTTAAKGYKKRTGAPKGLQSFMEPLILFVRDEIARPNIGEKKHARYMPFLLTVFFFIWVNNLLGLIPLFPGSANLTGNINFTFTMAIITFLVVTFSGNANYWKHIFATPGVPVWLLPIMIPVELIGMLTKPFALMVRLFANIAAGHIVVISLISLIFIAQTVWVSPASIALTLFIDGLELLVAALQAYVFTMLASLFIGAAVEEAHH